MQRLWQLAKVTVLGALLLAPQVALACPSCAGQRQDGVAKLVILGTMILLPFAIVWVVVKGVKRLEGDATSQDRV